MYVKNFPDLADTNFDIDHLAVPMCLPSVQIVKRVNQSRISFPLAASTKVTLKEAPQGDNYLLAEKLAIYCTTL